MLNKWVLLCLFGAVHTGNGVPVDALAAAFDQIQFDDLKQKLEVIENSDGNSEELDKLFTASNQDNLVRLIMTSTPEWRTEVLRLSRIRTKFNYLIVAFNKGLIQVAEAFLEKSPDEVTQQRVLTQLIDDYDDAEQNRVVIKEARQRKIAESKKKYDFILKSINKTTPSELLKQNYAVDMILDEAINKGLPEVCLAILQKAPDATKIDAASGRGSQGVLRVPIENYVKIPEIDAANQTYVERHKNAIICAIEKGNYDFSNQNEVKSFRGSLRVLVGGMIREFDKGAQKELIEPTRAGALEIYKAMIQKYPEGLKKDLGYNLAMYRDLDLEKQQRMAPFLNYAISEYKKIFKDEKLENTDYYKRMLGEIGLQEGGAYTLDEVLKKALLDLAP